MVICLLMISRCLTLMIFDWRFVETIYVVYLFFILYRLFDDIFDTTWVGLSYTDCLMISLTKTWIETPSGRFMLILYRSFDYIFTKSFIKSVLKRFFMLILYRYFD
jgi:hypothetical protein